jgi:hypothetical protein
VGILRYPDSLGVDILQQSSEDDAIDNLN